MWQTVNETVIVIHPYASMTIHYYHIRSTPQSTSGSLLTRLKQKTTIDGSTDQKRAFYIPASRAKIINQNTPAGGSNFGSRQGPKKTTELYYLTTPSKNLTLSVMIYSNIFIFHFLFLKSVSNVIA